MKRIEGFTVGRGRQASSHLAPDEHSAEDDLQPVEEVVSDDDDSGASCGPTLAGADGLDAGRSSEGHCADHPNLNLGVQD